MAEVSSQNRSIFLAKLLLITIPILHFIGIINYIAYGFCGRQDSTVFISPWRTVLSILLPIYVARVCLSNQYVDRSGALAAVVIGFVLSITNRCFSAAFFAFVIAGSKATNFRANVKQVMEEGYIKGGQKNWLHIVCKAGIVANVAIIYVLDVGCGEFLIDFSSKYMASSLSMSVLGALACSSGDTWASQIGSVVGWDNPRLITTWEKVPRGTHGAVSFIGLISSAFGGAIVGLAYYIALVSCFSQDMIQASIAQWPVVIVGAATGLIGSVVDSILGAILQYSGINEETGVVVQCPGKQIRHICGSPILDNHGINMVTSIIMAFVSPSIGVVVWGYFM